jgi:hypothetical protein
MRMKNTFMASTAALLLGSLVIASAQNAPREERGSQGGDRPSATQSQRGSGASQQEQRQQPSAQGEQRSQGQRGDRDRSQTTGQGQREQTQRDQPEQGKRGAQKDGSKRNDTTGQGSREDRDTQRNQDRQQQGKQRDQQQDRQQQGKQRDQQDRQQQGQQRRDQQQDRQQQGKQRDQQQDRQQQGQQRDQQQDRQQQGQRQEGGGRVTVTAEQQTRIRETIFSGSNVPRVDRVNFSIRVGTVIPASVRIVEVPSVLIEIHPEWRGHSYFVTGDEIVICDSSRNIVAMVPVGASNARTGQGRPVSGGVADLSADEIREVQVVLMREGFSVEADGRLGPRTRDALIQFQRRNGLQATGQIDSRTITSLGVNIRGSGDSTTGQGRSQPGGDNAPGNNNPPSGNNPGNNPSGDGSNRGGLNQNQPNAGGNNQRGTTGQGGAPNNQNTNNPDNNASPGDRPNSPGGNTPNNGAGNRPNNPGSRPNNTNDGAGAR